MVQFLSINFFFLDFFNFCWVFQKFLFFCVTLYVYQKLSNLLQKLPLKLQNILKKVFRIFFLSLSYLTSVVSQFLTDGRTYQLSSHGDVCNFFTKIFRFFWICWVNLLVALDENKMYGKYIWLLEQKDKALNFLQYPSTQNTTTFL